MKRQVTETFDFYETAGGIGRPYLARIGRTVTWSDGSLFHYPEFAEALDTDGLRRELTALFQTLQQRPKRKARSEGFGMGSVVGYLSAVPQGMAERAYEIVKQYFEQALRKLLEMRHAIQARANEFAPNLPERPEPRTNEPDESFWLFDSGRDYLDQMDSYRQRKVGGAK